MLMMNKYNLYKYNLLFMYMLTGSIYIIKSNKIKEVYIGSTKHTILERFNQHMRDFNNGDKKCSSANIIKYGDSFCELLEKVKYSDVAELRKREKEIIKSKIYDCVNITWNTTEEDDIIHYYYEDNKFLDFICETLNKMASQYFFYKNETLYSYDIHNKMWHEGKIEVMKKFISDELYDYIFELLNDSIVNEIYLQTQIKQLKNYCLKNKGQEEIVKSYRTRYLFDNQNINFDMNPFLLGFSNGVYDLEKNIFRDYEYSDYITTETGYPYRKATDMEIKESEKIFSIIEPNDEKRYLLYQIYSSGLIGKLIEKFFIFNGSGRNGKSKLTDVMELILGNYFTKLHLGLICGCDKKVDSSNEHTAGKNKIDKKRFCVFSEPESTKTITNARIKELTGSKNFSGRKMGHENVFTIKNQGTYILECNKKPKLSEEATHAEIERIVDFLFESRFTTNEEEIDEKNRIYKADYNISEKIIELKYGFLHVLINKAYEFINIDKMNLKIPNSVKERSNSYIQTSFIALDFLNEIATKTNEKKDYISIKKIFEKIKMTDAYLNSTKVQKREITFKFLVNFFSSNKETSNNYKEKFEYDNVNKKQARNVLVGYKFIEANSDSDTDE
jgi:phage/plasmid-associated DNA primase